MSTLGVHDVDSLLIGELARRTGKTASAIRYYEQMGLLEAPARSGGKRRYPFEALRTVAVIKTAQRAGLSLEEIKLLLAAPTRDAVTIEQLRRVAQEKLPALRRAIERAQIVRQWLEDAARCECPSLEDCPLFDDSDLLPERTLAFG